MSAPALQSEAMRLARKAIEWVETRSVLMRGQNGKELPEVVRRLREAIAALEAENRKLREDVNESALTLPSTAQVQALEAQLRDAQITAAKERGLSEVHLNRKRALEAEKNKWQERAQKASLPNQEAASEIISLQIELSDERRIHRESIEIAETRVKELEVALKSYGEHRICARFRRGLVFTEGEDCDCGLQAALRGKP